MKFTLKLQLDSPTELAKFIQDMNMEIDMPFLKDGENVISLSELILKKDNEIFALRAQLLELLPTHKAEVKPEKELLFNGEPKYSVTSNSTLRTCQECGNPVPDRKKAPFCSPKCYNKNYISTHSSKKVKSPQSKPD